MTNNYWIKLYHEVLDDPKMGRLSDSAYRRCIELFLMAGRDGNDDGSLPDFDDIAWKLRVSNQQLQQDLAELEAAGIITIVDGNPFVTNFAKRQAKISNADKQKAYRERKRLESLEESDQDDTEPLPECYQSVTDGNTEKKRVEKKRVDNSAHDAQNDNEPTPQEQLITHFEALTFIDCGLQGASVYKSKWWHPADALYMACGMDLVLAKQAITEAVKILKKKGYKYNSIASVQSTAVNWLDEYQQNENINPLTAKAKEDFKLFADLSKLSRNEKSTRLKSLPDHLKQVYNALPSEWRSTPTEPEFVRVYRAIVPESSGVMSHV